MANISFKHLDQTVLKVKNLDEIIKSGEKSLRYVAEDFEETAEAKQAVNELRDVMLEYAKMKRDIKQYIDAVDQSKTSFLALNDKSESCDLVAIFQDHLTTLQSKNTDDELYQSKEVADFTQTVWNQHHRESQEKETLLDDDEIKMTQVDGTQFLCPITKVEFIEPVKNTDCGHSYSRVAIATHINNMKQKAKCPIPGCTHKVSLQSLVENNILAYELRMKNKIS